MNKKNRSGKFIRGKENGNGQAQKSVDEIKKDFFKDKEEGKFESVTTEVKQPVVEEKVEVKEIVETKGDDFYDPNFQELMGEETSTEEETNTVTDNNKQKIKHNEKTGGFKMTKDTKDFKVENGFTRPLNMQYGVTSIEFLSKFKALLAAKLPEVSKCAVQVSVAVNEVPVVKNNVTANASQVKFVIKLDLTNSPELRRESAKASFNANVDPQFEALFEKSQNEATASASNNYKKMPKYMQENGKHVLYNDYFDVIKFEPFRSKEGKVWDNLVLLEVNASASILSILGVDTKLYVAYTDCVRRMKQLEESVKLKQKMKGKTGIQVPTIYFIQVNVDDVELLKSSTAMFKKPNYQQQGNKSGNSYKAALADFIGR